MKAFPLLVSLLAVSLLPGCIYLGSRDTAHFESRIPSVAHSLSRNISYSVEWTPSNPTAQWYNLGDIKDAVRARLKESGMFDTVYHAELGSASNHHIHFDFEMSPRADAGVASVLLSGFTLMTLPGYLTNDMRGTASVIINGKEVDCYHDQRVGRVYLWLPLMLASPFLNRSTSGEHMLNESIDAMLEQVKASRR